MPVSSAFRLGFLSAMTIGLAGAAVAKTAAPSLQVSENFLLAAQQAQAGGNAASARAIASSPHEKYIAGQLALQQAATRNDYAGMRTALADILQSGVAPQSELPRLWFLSGYYNYALANYDNAITQLNQAKQLGYNDPDLTLMLGDSYARRKKAADGLPLVLQGLQAEAVAGKPITADNYERAISIAYSAGKWNDVATLYQRRVALTPTPGVWRSALVNSLAAPGLSDQVQLDLYRLMSANGALASERDYEAYATAAAARGNDAEAKAVIEAGRSAGKLTKTNAASVKLLSTSSAKAAKQVAALPGLAKKAQTAANGAPALAAAEDYLALGQYTEAVPLFRLALSKGGVDTNRANTRLGISLARSGDLAGGKAALAQVTEGDWSRVAGFWNVWIDQRTKQSSAAPRVVPTLG